MIIILESNEVETATRLAKALTDADDPSESWVISKALQDAMAALITHRFNAIYHEEPLDDIVPLTEMDDIVGLIDEMLTNPMFEFLSNLPVDRIELLDGMGGIAFYCNSFI